MNELVAIQRYGGITRYVYDDHTDEVPDPIPAPKPCHLWPQRRYSPQAVDVPKGEQEMMGKITVQVAGPISLSEARLLLDGLEDFVTRLNASHAATEQREIEVDGHSNGTTADTCWLRARLVTKYTGQSQ